MQQCKNICERFIYRRKPKGGTLEEQNCVFCAICREYLKRDCLIKGNLCPCCKTKVRFRTRNKSLPLIEVLKGISFRFEKL